MPVLCRSTLVIITYFFVLFIYLFISLVLHLPSHTHHNHPMIMYVTSSKYYLPLSCLSLSVVLVCSAVAGGVPHPVARLPPHSPQ